MRLGDRTFSAVWAVDTEFRALPGERPEPICLVARELQTGHTIRLWQDELIRLDAPPYPIGPESLLVAYYASAEVGCHLALGWPPPSAILDLFTEFRATTNGREVPCGNGLVGALAFHGLDAIDAVEKDTMRALAIRGGPWSSEEKAALLEYCESDVLALDRLVPRMLESLDGERALLRGRFMTAAAHIEHCGIPIDLPALLTLRENWGRVRGRLIEHVDRAYGVFDGTTFKEELWARWLARNGVPWPRLSSGRLALDRETFREMARLYPSVGPIHQLRMSLAELRLEDLAVGSDGRNRCLLSAFRSKTGRNQPSSSRFIFGQPSWLRGLIKPASGRVLAYVDWEQQEFGIAAALSGDPAMIAAYLSGDPYLEFARQAGAAPRDATRESHGRVRELFKACALAVQYGMGAEGLARRIGCGVAEGRELLETHRRTYARFWQWSDGAVDCAMAVGSLRSAFGWPIQVSGNANARSLRNFPMQANGAEMLRIACCFLTEAGVSVCAPVHDAILVEATEAEADAVVAETQALMARASAIVLQGFTLRSEAKIIRYPDRFLSERAVSMWETVWNLVHEPSQGEMPDVA